MKTGCHLAIALFTLTISPVAPAEETKAPVPEFIADTQRLDANSNIEVRFRTEMVPPSLVGQEPEVDILDIRPAWPGKFSWISRSSVRFRPDAKPKLGAEYTFTLAKGLKDLKGRVVPVDQWQRSTYEFGVAVGYTWIDRKSTAGIRKPEVVIIFNAPVSAAKADESVWFESKEKDIAYTNVRQATAADLLRYYKLPRTWAQVTGRPSSDLKKDEAAKIPYAIVATPAEMLRAGKTWELYLEKGISAKGAKLKNPYRHTVGNVPHLEVSGVAPVSTYITDRYLSFSFNKPLREEIDSGRLERYVHITPEVEGQTIELNKNRRSVIVRGKFTPKIDHQLTVRGGLPAADATIITRTQKRSFQFQPCGPSLSLPEFDTGQLLGGRQKYPVRLGNIAKTRIRVKEAGPRELFQLLRTYRHYSDFESRNGRRYSSREIPFDVVPGRVVFDKEFPAGVGLDKLESITLDWAEVLGGKRPGSLFLSVEATPRKDVDSNSLLVAQSLIQLTDLGMVWKTDSSNALVYVFSQSSGKPVEGAIVQAFDDDRNVIGEGRTGSNGMATLDVSEATWLTGRKGKDRYGMRFDRRRHEVSLWRMDVPRDYQHRYSNGRRTLFFTDRPVYKPGETVYFKALLRQLKEDKLHVLGAQEAKLRFYDASGRKLVERDITFSETGAFDDRLTLPQSPLGSCRVEVIYKPGEGDEQVDDWANKSAWHRTASAWFQVQEFKPNAFEVRFENDKIETKEKTVSFPLSANYLMGAPLSKSRVVWNARQTPQGFSAADFEGFRFGDSRSHWISTEAGWKKWRTEVPQPSAEQGEQFLDKEGRTTIVARRSPVEDITGPLALSVETDITDVNQQTLHRSTRHVIHPSDFYLGIAGLDNITKAGNTVDLKIAPVTPEGKLLDRTVTTKVTVGRIVWNSVRLKSATRSNYVTNDFLVEPLLDEDIEIAAGETATAAFAPESAGTFLITARSVLENGKTVSTVASVDVYGSDWAPWWQTDGLRLELTADKEKYAPGENAKILVKSNLSGQALVTLERGGILSQFVADIPDNSTTIDIPLDETCAPNVSVSVVVLRGAGDSTKKNPKSEYRVGYCTLQVDPAAYRLDVAIDPASPEIRPGAETEITTTVTDSNGDPVPNAEVTLYAADEGVLSLVHFAAPNPEQVFLSNWPLLVRSGVSLSRMLAEGEEEMSFANKGFDVGGGGEGGGVDQPLMARKNFKSTAFWEPTLRTDEDGKVRVRFYAPDNLTRFRIMAVAAEGADRFGSAEGEFTINKPLMLEPAVPRFAHVGDEITVRAVLHNRTDKAATVECRLEADAKVEVGAGGQARVFSAQIQLAPGETNDVRIPVRFLDAGETVWNWSAVSKGNPKLNDAVESRFDIEFAEPELRELHFVSLRESADENILQRFNPELLEGTGRVDISVSNSRLLDAAPAVEALLNYPYGCVEQTSSSTLPWIVLMDVKEAVPILNRPDEEYDAAIASGCARLLSMQTTEGGLSYWPGSGDPLLWASNMGGYVLAKAKMAGADIPQHRLDALTDWMTKQLTSLSAEKEPRHLVEFAESLHTLALLGKPQAAYNAVLARRAAELPAPARYRLVLAILESGGDKDWCREILGKDRPMTGQWNYWLGGTYQDALKLMVHTRLDGIDSPETVEAYGRLMKSRRARGDWGTTFSNAWGLQAAVDYTHHSTLTSEPSQIAIRLKDKKKSMTLPPQPASEMVSFDFKNLKRSQSLDFESKGNRDLIAEVEVVARPARMPQEARSQGFSISRKYERLTPDGELESTDNLRIGDLVKVTLAFDIPEPVNYLVIDDPLPAILEGVNPAFKGKAGTTAKKQTTRNYWWNSRQEVRDDRVVYFRDSCYQLGKYEIAYLARVIAAGTVTAPPAKIEGMYEPDRFGLSASQVLSAKATGSAVTSR